MSDIEDSESWIALDRELDAWAAAARVPRMWLRDDDARAPGPALDRLLALTAAVGVPVHMAVIPKGLDPRLSERLRDAPHALVLQHGFAHRNHAPAGTPASEFAHGRSVAEASADLTAGWHALAAADLPNLLPVLVPPWNHISDPVVRVLPGLGYRGLSTYDPRCAAHPAPGLLQVNIHTDVTRWRGGARFRGAPKVLAALVGHLAARRTGRADADESTGLLTHHGRLDAASWTFLGTLLARTAARVRWVSWAEMLDDD